MTVIADVRDLVVAYRHHVVLDGISLEVAAGEVLGLLGPNGGGKSTLLLTLAGLLTPTSGTVTVAGHPATRLAIEATGTVGLITARPGLYPLLTGWENLDFFGGLYGLTPEDVRDKTRGFLAELGLTDHLDKPVGHGSSGMQQKISLARALLMDPQLLLLDEPTSNLDPLAAEVIHATARSHADAGHAVVWVTHDLHAAEKTCDRAVLVRQTVLYETTFDRDRATAPRSPLLDAWEQHVGGQP